MAVFWNYTCRVACITVLTLLFLGQNTAFASTVVDVFVGRGLIRHAPPGRQIDVLNESRRMLDFAENVCVPNASVNYRILESGGHVDALDEAALSSRANPVAMINWVIIRTGGGTTGFVEFNRNSQQPPWSFAVVVDVDFKLVPDPSTYGFTVNTFELFNARPAASGHIGTLNLASVIQLAFVDAPNSRGEPRNDNGGEAKNQVVFSVNEIGKPRKKPNVTVSKTP